MAGGLLSTWQRPWKYLCHKRSAIQRQHISFKRTILFKVKWKQFKTKQKTKEGDGEEEEREREGEDGDEEEEEEEEWPFQKAVTPYFKGQKKMKGNQLKEKWRA